MTGFATDFAAPADNHSEWVERMRQWVPRFLADQYVHMDPARRPVAQLIGLDTQASGDFAADVVARYDTGLQLWIRAEQSPDGWVVTTVAPLGRDVERAGGVEPKQVAESRM